MSEADLAILRYVRDHGVGTGATIAHDVLGAPRTTFGRMLKLGAAERQLAELVGAGLLARRGQDERAEFMLTKAGRQLLRDVALRDGRIP